LIDLGGRFYALLFLVLLGVGFLIQLGKLSEIKDFKADPDAYYSPIFTYISTFGAIGGIVIFGRPYALPMLSESSVS
jgi:hypothetical protein